MQYSEAQRSKKFFKFKIKIDLCIFNFQLVEVERYLECTPSLLGVYKVSGQ